MSDLLPCPFCGCAAGVTFGEHAFHDAKVRCLSCSAEGPMFDVDDGGADERGRNNDAAIAAWNTRAPLGGMGGGEDQGSSALRSDTHRAPEGPVVAASPLEIAYGCLWRTVSDNEKLHQARKLLTRCVDHDGQRRGVEWAAANLPPVSDAEIRSIEI